MLKIEEVKAILKKYLTSTDDETLNDIEKLMNTIDELYNNSNNTGVLSDEEKENIKKEGFDEAEKIWREKYRNAFFGDVEDVEDVEDEEDKTVVNIDDILKNENVEYAEQRTEIHTNDEHITIDKILEG